MTNRTEGKKYRETKDMGVEKIADRIRKDLAMAGVISRMDSERTGIPCLPVLAKSKVSVRIKRYSMGQSITVWIDTPSFFRLLNPTRVRAEFEGRNPTDLPRESEECCQLRKEVEGVANAYNYDNSDPATDHSDTKFYLHVNIGTEWKANAEEVGLHKRFAAEREENLRAGKRLPKPPETLVEDFIPTFPAIDRTEEQEELAKGKLQANLQEDLYNNLRIRANIICRTYQHNDIEKALGMFLGLRLQPERRSLQAESATLALLVYKRLVNGAGVFAADKFLDTVFENAVSLTTELRRVP